MTEGTTVAVKQLSAKSRQGNREFLNEIGIISTLRHPNLVRLFGCCMEGNQLLLIYEFMENNSLGRALFGKSTIVHLNILYKYLFSLNTCGVVEVWTDVINWNKKISLPSYFTVPVMSSIGVSIECCGINHDTRWWYLLESINHYNK